MKPVPLLMTLLTVGVALSAVTWLTRSDSAVDAPPPQTDPEVKPKTDHPFEFATEGPQPKAVIDETMHDFDSMELGTTETHAFVIRNEGDAPLRIKVGKVACKCTVAELDQDVVPPGESVEILMSWEPENQADEFHQKADVWTNDPNNSKLELHIKGAVEELAMVSPGGDWELNRVATDEPCEFIGLIMSRHVQEFQILDYQSSTDLITVEFEPLSDAELERRQIKSGYSIHGTLLGEMPVGRFRETLTVMTDMKGGRDFDITVVGTRMGPFSIVGNRWVSQDMLLNMGDVDAKEGKSARLAFFISREEKPVEFAVESTSPEFLDVTFVKDESFDVPVREKFWLTFTIPPGAPIGSWTGDESATVVVTTNRENVSRFEMSVDMTVRD